MAEELELKLILTPEAAATLAGSTLLSGPSRTISQRSTYYDTIDLSLVEAGLCLRVREAEGRFIQTLKGDSQPGAGFFARSEADREIDGPVPRIEAGGAVAILAGGRDLQALFEVRNERRRWQLPVGKSVVEVALDRGEVVAGGRSTSFLEIELELVRGDAAAIFALGRDILALVPARLGVVSKAERGYRLLEALPARLRAEPISLPDEASIGEALPQVVAACLRHFLLNLDLLTVEPTRVDARAALALHQCRVALRRLRSALKMFHPLLRGDEETEGLDRGVQALARILGEARDLDVLIEDLAEGADRERLRVARDQAYARAREALTSPATDVFLFDLVEWLAGGTWRQAPELLSLRETPASALAVDALRHFRRKARKAGKRFARLDDEQRHTLRKNAKNLRYAAEFFASLFVDSPGAGRIEPFISALESVQNRLGDWNDRVTAPATLAALGITDSGATGGDDQRLLKAAERALREFDAVRRFWPQQGRIDDEEDGDASSPADGTDSDDTAASKPPRADGRPAIAEGRPDPAQGEAGRKARKEEAKRLREKEKREAKAKKKVGGRKDGDRKDGDRKAAEKAAPRQADGAEPVAPVAPVPPVPPVEPAPSVGLVQPVPPASNEASAGGRAPSVTASQERGPDDSPVDGKSGPAGAESAVPAGTSAVVLPVESSPSAAPAKGEGG